MTAVEIYFAHFSECACSTVTLRSGSSYLALGGILKVVDEALMQKVSSLD